MLEILNAIENSNLLSGDKKKLKMLFVGALEDYIKVIKAGEDLPESFDLTYEDEFFTISPVLERLGITQDDKTISPSMHSNDPFAYTVSELCTRRWVTISFPCSLLQLNGIQMVKLLNEVQDSLGKVAKVEQPKGFVNRPRRNFRKDV